MTATVKPWTEFEPAVSVVEADKLLLVDVSDTTEGAEGSIKIASVGTIATVFAPYIAEAETAENNATTQANAAAASAASAAAIVNISSVQTFTNPLRQAVRVGMTAAASGSNGIQILDNVQADFGTNNFTLYRKIFVATTRPAANQILSHKHDGTNGRIITLLTTGVVRFTINATTYDSTVALVSATNVVLDLAISVVRSSAAVAGSVSIYNSGVQLGTSVAISAGVPVTIDNAVSEFILGTSAVRTAGEFYQSLNYNRALTAAEVLSLSTVGPALADIGASNLITNPNKTFDTDAGWVASGGGSVASVVSGGEITLGADTIQQAYTQLNVAIPAGGSVRVVARVRRLNANTTRIRVQLATSNTGTNGLTLYEETVTSTTAYDIEFVAVNTGMSRQWIQIREQNGGSSRALIVEYFEVQNVGVTGQWSAENAQSNTGQIFDRPGNGNHALLPADGATIIGRPTAQPQQVRWTNTWAETQELQYIGGVNQNILPARAYIESIVGVITTSGGSGVQDIIVGDGSDNDRYVAITTGLAAGTKIFTLTATPFTDGTNLKLTVDPDANCTMSIAWTITYTTLE
jgi:hypothetical protein